MNMKLLKTSGVRRRSPRAPSHAFTLVELMISIALVLVIILGVNAIFKMASDTVNASIQVGGSQAHAMSAVPCKRKRKQLTTNSLMLCCCFRTFKIHQ